jgi:hypothetical protein
MKFITQGIFLVSLFIFNFSGSIYSQVPGISFIATKTDSCAPFINVEIQVPVRTTLLRLSGTLVMVHLLFRLQTSQSIIIMQLRDHTQLH